jgi:hypothetical protein
MPRRSSIILARAKTLGLRRYCTGLPCKYGHYADRYVIGHHCVTCSAIEDIARSRAYRALHKNKIVARQRAWEARNREHVRTKKAAWREANREEIRAYSRRWWAKRREHSGAAFL